MSMPIQRECQKCRAVFFAKPNWVRMGMAKFCSRTCTQLARRTGKIVNCHQCGLEVYKSGKDLRKSKSKNYFCTKKCSLTWHNADRFGSKHQNWKFASFAYKSRMRRSAQKEVCVLCQSHDSRILAVHHIDQNRKNNQLKNLAWLCHNCHFLVHHYPLYKQKFDKRMYRYAHTYM